MSNIQVVGVCKEFVSARSGNRVRALEDVNLEIADGEFFAILGPSGCGKSTLLSIADGLESASAGQIIINGKIVSQPGPDRAMCFQEHALFPWKTVSENVEFGLLVRGLPRDERQEIVNRYLSLVGLQKFAAQYPHELSGGMKQRCALARTFALEADTLFMDEPFAAADPQTRIILQEELLRIWDHRDQRKTVAFVTHSIDEAVFLSDRVAVMTARPGKILEIFDVPLRRPRDDVTRLDPSFTDLVAHLWGKLRSQAEQSF